MREHRKLTKNSIIRTVKKDIYDLKIIENLSIYTTLYKTIFKESKSSGRKGLYFVILLNSRTKEITVERFSVNQFKSAINSYVEKEKRFYGNINANIVLVHSNDSEKIKASYPNYFMDMQALIRPLV